MIILRAFIAVSLVFISTGQETVPPVQNFGGNAGRQTVSNEHFVGKIDPNPRDDQPRVQQQGYVEVPQHQGHQNAQAIPNQRQVLMDRGAYEKQPRQAVAGNANSNRLEALRNHPKMPEGLATSEECAEDVNRICGDKMRLTNLEILSCMNERIKNDDDLSEDCHVYLWEYKLNVTHDPKFTRVAREVCKKPLEKFTECQQSDDANGKMIPCLLEHKNEIEYRPCYHFLVKMATIIFSDYRLVCDFVKDCKQSIDNLGCGRIGKIETANEQQTNPGKGHSQGSVIHCLENEIVDGNEVDEKCAKQIVRLSELSADDFHLDRNLYFACKEDRESLCEEVTAGEGRIYKCLFQHKFDHEMSPDCRDALTTRQRLVAQDYKASYALQTACQKDIEALQCMKHPIYRSQGGNDHGDLIGLSGMLLCIEQAKLAGTYLPHPKCDSELTEFRRLLSDDYKMSPEIVKGCQNEITAHCNEQGIEKHGGTIHCLMGLAQNDVKNKDRYKMTLSGQCMKAMIHLLKADNAVNDYRMDRALAEACNPVVQTACASHQPGDPLILSCLMENLYSRSMTEPCRKRLMEMQYFITRDFSLDEQFYSKCYKDSTKLCSEDLGGIGTSEISMPFSMVLSCLYRHIPNVPRAKEDGRTSKACAEEVRRVMKHRALNVELNQNLDEACRLSLGKYCSQSEIGKGFELVCLQDHFENITLDEENGDKDATKCIDQLEQITEIEEAEGDNLDNALLRACEADVENLCESERDDEEEGDVMKCLIERKDELSKDCEAGVTHFQLIELQDIKFSYNFMKACKKDITDNCQAEMKGGPTKKNEIIECLSGTHLESVLNKKKSPLSENCISQLTVENFQRHDDNMKLNPEIRKVCQADYKKHCKNSNVKGLECLRLNHDKISPKCRKELFKLEREEAIDPHLDVVLMRTCKPAIMKYCGKTRGNAEAILECLITVKENLAGKCYDIVREREREQFSDINLNPELLDACGTDMTKHCADILTALKSHEMNDGEDPHGEVIGCLKEIKTSSNDLTENCARHIRFVMEEEEKDYKLDPMLTLNCVDSINNFCQPDAVTDVVECLKVMFFQNKLSDDKNCMLQVARLLKEGRSDIMADPVLHNACQLDIQHYCTDVAEGRGRVMSCILDIIEHGGKPVTKQCSEAVLQRQKMWDYAREHKLETFGGLVAVIWNSPQHNYLFTMVTVIFLVILFFGVFCGRMTKRVSRQRKML